MVKYILKGHSFRNEVQTIIQVFYPNRHYYEANDVECDCICAVSGIDSSSSWAEIYENGKLLAEYKFRHNGLECGEREKKRIVKLSLYECFKSITGYTPKWGMITGIRPAKTVNELINSGWSEKEAFSFLKEKYFVSDNKARLTMEVAASEREMLKRNSFYDYSLYIGIPFCPTRCLYCSFTSYPIDRYAKVVETYIDRLVDELKYISDKAHGKRLMSIYIGGGTPTSLNEKQLRRLMTAVVSHFDVKNAVEFTVEAGRADTITRQKLNCLKEFDVNRISINPQTMNDKTLETIGRRHTVDDVKRVFGMAREAGFENINMDLILGLPSETLSDVENTLSEIEKLSPESVTVHTLSVKRASRLKEDFDNYSLINTDEIERMLEISETSARNMNMRPYYMYRQKNMVGNFENVGYCKKGCESVYNVEIMEEKQSIVACGAGSVSKRVYPDGRIERSGNVKDVALYIEKIDEMIERKRKLLTGF
ncbi:MAG: coproporphyrinogen dehydrogenase HemZ [Firmicutes bacterium]|nr:coproporphyrinogen dehydrogenase HemZ [Bacillota bacterium]